MGAKRGKKARSRAPQGRPEGRQRLGLIIFAVLFVLLFIGFAVAQGIGAPSVPSGDVALVQNLPSDVGHISEQEFEKRLQQQVAQGTVKKLPPEGSKKYEELQEGALGEILQAVWIQGEAEERGISPTQKQIETELESIKKQSFPTPAAYKSFLKKSHLTPEEVNDRVKLQVLSKELQESVNAEAPTPSEADLKAYYEAEKATQFTSKETRDIRLIINKSKKKVGEAKAQLEKDNSPASWKKVVPKYSENPTGNNGGLQKEVAAEFLTGPVKGAIFGSATGELVGPTKFQKNWILTEVVKLHPEKVKTFAEVKAQIGKTLAEEKQQEFFSEFIKDWEAKWQSRTFCASSHLIKKCSNYRGTGHPESANPACYEANPKTPAKECPAPVTPTSPALPGTVTEQEPKGEPFQQRPKPEKSAQAEAGSEVPGAPAPSGE